MAGPWTAEIIPQRKENIKPTANLISREIEMLKHIL